MPYRVIPPYVVTRLPEHVRTAKASSLSQSLPKAVLVLLGQVLPKDNTAHLIPTRLFLNVEPGCHLLKNRACCHLFMEELLQAAETTT